MLRFLLGSCLGGLVGSVLLLVLPGSAFDAVVPVLVGLAVVLVLVQPWLGRRVAARAVRQEQDPRPHGSALVWLLVALTGVYGGYFGAAQGVLLMGVLGVGLEETLQRLNAVKNVLAGAVNAVAAVVFVAVADVDWLVVVLIAVGSTVGAQVGARYGRRLPPWGLRAFIALVGTAAIIALTLG